MKKTLSKLSKFQAQEIIDSFFQHQEFTAEQVKKIKRLAMKYNIKIKDYKKLFCKSCLSHLKGKIRISKTDKTITCNNCDFRNKFRI